MKFSDSQVVLRALMLATDMSTSAVKGCECDDCVKTRAQVLDWFLSEAREQLEREARGPQVIA